MELKYFITTAALDDLRPPVILSDPPYVIGADNEEIDAWLSQCSPEEASSFQSILVGGNVRANGVRGVAAVGPASAGAPHPPTWRLARAYDLRVERRAASDWPALCLTLADAIELLHEPLHLVLENAFNDFAFVCHLAGPTNGPVLRELNKLSRRLQVHGGGAGEAKKWLGALTEPPLSPDKWRRALRTWVLFDQDAGDTDAREPSSAAEKMMEACEQVHAAFPAGLSWICLRRREIESYVPDRGLRAEAPPNRLPVAEQIITWRGDPAYRAHAWAFDLKKGLSGDLKSRVPKPDRDAVKARQALPTAAMVKQPFDSLPDADVAALAYGLGEGRLNDALTHDPQPAWTADIPAEYDRGPDHQAPRPDLIQSLLDRI